MPQLWCVWLCVPRLFNYEWNRFGIQDMNWLHCLMGHILHQYFQHPKYGTLGLFPVVDGTVVGLATVLQRKTQDQLPGA